MKTPASNLTLAAIAAAIGRECPGIATHDIGQKKIHLRIDSYASTFWVEDNGMVWAQWGAPGPAWDDPIYTIEDAIQHARWFVNTYTDHEAPITAEEQARGEAVMAKWRELAEQGRLDRQRGQCGAALDAAYTRGVEDGLHTAERLRASRGGPA